MKAKSREDYWFSGFYKHQSTSCATLSILNKFFNIYHYTGAYLGEGGGGELSTPPERFKIMVSRGELAQTENSRIRPRLEVLHVLIPSSVNCKIIVVF